MVYRRRGTDLWLVAVPTRTGRTKRSTGTTHRGTAKAIERMLVDLGASGQRAWDLLDRVEANTLSLGDLFDAYRLNDLDGLRERLRDVDLSEHVDGWAAWLADRVRPDTAAHYVAHVRTLIPVDGSYQRSQFTAAAIATWLAGRTRLVQKRKPGKSPPRRKENPAPAPVSASTRRKYLAAMQSFATYLVAVGVLTTNPTRDVDAPPAPRPRVVELELSDVKRIVDGAQSPFRALFALLYGAGVEISAALACIDGDVDTARREVRARGTKAHSRDRVVRVAEWAWPYVEAHLATLTPGERLFRGLTRWQVGDVHRDRLKALGLPHHRVHDSRHFYAVRAVRAGTPYELVARQLGHADVQMVARVYGRYAPRSDERDRWEKLAAEHDAARENALTQQAEQRGKVSEMGAPRGAASEKQHEPNTVSDWLVDSRGGTRTHDPGIMSSSPAPATDDSHADDAARRGTPEHDKD
jgi:integrase